MGAVVLQNPLKPGALHTAVVQDLARRLNVSCPAEPDHVAARQDIPSSSNVQHRMASVSLKSPQAAKLEAVFVSSESHSANTVATWLEHARLSTNETSTALRDLAHSSASWASFCIQHDATLSSKSAQTTAKATKAKSQARRAQMQAIFADSNISKAVAADPLLLSYRSETLVRHMQHLQDLLGKTEASQMVAKLPALLHYKPATLSDKLDRLYDLLPAADVGKMVVRSPFLLGLTHETLTTRIKALQVACPKADVERMIEYYPSLLECKTGKVVGNLKALQALLPEAMDTTAVIQYMPTLLLSDIKKVEQKYTRMQILCMHKPRWRTDLAMIQCKPATFARLLGVSNRVLDRLSFFIEQQGEMPDLAATTIMLMTHSKFMTRFPEFHAWQSHRHAEQHINAWQSSTGVSSALAVLSSMDHSDLSGEPLDLEPPRNVLTVN